MILAKDILNRVPGLNPVDAWIAQECGWPLGQAYSSQSSHLLTLLAQKQEALLQETLALAAQSHFYSSLPKISGLHELSLLPFTSAENLADWGDFLCVSQGQVQRMVSLNTSGTTTKPKRLAFSQEDLARTRDFFQAGMSQLVEEGDRVEVWLPGSARPHGICDLLGQALPWATIIPASPETSSISQKPQVLVLLSTQLSNLLKGPIWPELKGLLTSGEALDPIVRSLCRTLLPQCQLIDHYGLTESCFGGGVECLAQSQHYGYHLRHLDLLIEIIDSQGHTLPPGEYGEVVITTLQRQAMPLIRYRTGDFSSLLTTACPCGSPFPRLAQVLGRLDSQGQVWAVPKQSGHNRPIFI